MANYYPVTLKANQEVQVPVIGKLILVDSIGVAPGVNITPVLGGNTGKTMPLRQTAFKVNVDYDMVILSAPVDCTIALFLSMTDVSLGFTSGSSVNVQGQVTISNGPAARVPVDLAGGVVNVTATNVGISNDDTKPVPVRRALLGQLVNPAPVAVNTGAAQQVIADATLRSLRFRNASDSSVIALGGSTVTLAGAAIVLMPGESYVEDDAAGATWYATTDKNGASLCIMGAK